MSPFTILPGHDVPSSCALSTKDALKQRWLLLVAAISGTSAVALLFCRVSDCLGGEFRRLLGEERFDASFGDVRPVCVGSTSIVEILGLAALLMAGWMVCRLLRWFASIWDTMLGVPVLLVPGTRNPNRTADSLETGSESTWLETTGSSWLVLPFCGPGECDLEDASVGGRTR